MSAPERCNTCPYFSVFSIFSSFKQESAKEFGRNEERVANTPIRSLPPNLGGRTVGEKGLPVFSEITVIPSESGRLTLRR